MAILRGIIPTYIRDGHVVLAKGSPFIRGTYEIHLAVYFAVVQRHSTFTLAISADATVDDDLRGYIAKWGGQIVHDKISDFSVSFTAKNAAREELETWVLGDQVQWVNFRNSLASPWLIERLRLGSAVAAADLQHLLQELSNERLSGTNIDGEPLQPALLALAEKARQTGGTLFVQ